MKELRKFDESVACGRGALCIRCDVRTCFDAVIDDRCLSAEGIIWIRFLEGRCVNRVNYRHNKFIHMCIMYVGSGCKRETG